MVSVPGVSVRVRSVAVPAAVSVAKPRKLPLLWKVTVPVGVPELAEVALMVAVSVVGRPWQTGVPVLFQVTARVVLAWPTVIVGMVEAVLALKPASPP